MTAADSPLHDLRVLDAATLLAGPMAGAILGDFGADVIKLEHPKGDPSRRLGPSQDGVPLTWKVVGRNKQAITLHLGTERGQALFRRLVTQSDVLIESFRPGVLERWNLAPDDLLELNPRLVVARVTGFGQHGPYAKRPGFGTIAEAMSGFAAITGTADGPPTLPAFGLADGIAALATVIAIQTAVHERVRSGRGQIVDLAIIEPILAMLGPQPTWFEQLGYVQQRRGNQSSFSAPRNTYKSRDGRWLAVSASAQSVCERVMRLVGHPEVIDEPWFSTGEGRLAHAERLDRWVAEWIGERDADEVIDVFEANEAAVAPVQDIRDVFIDPQYRALESLCSVPDVELGQVTMQNALFRLSRTPGRPRWAGRPLGHDNDRVYGEMLGLKAQELTRLKAEGVI